MNWFERFGRCCLGLFLGALFLDRLTGFLCHGLARGLVGHSRSSVETAAASSPDLTLCRSTRVPYPAVVSAGCQCDAERVIMFAGPLTDRSPAKVIILVHSGSCGDLRGTVLATPFGQVYGSSQNKGYLNLRPAADNAASPSITTYTFASPTPAAGWGFVLGDVDADQVLVRATGPGGAAVAVGDLGFQGVFNYCDVPSPRPGSCSGVAAPFDLPTWDPATGILRGNAAALDTVVQAAGSKPRFRCRPCPSPSPSGRDSPYTKPGLRRSPARCRAP